MNTISYWEKSVFFEQLDAVVIGGGIVGTNAAIRLKELHPKWKIAILERATLALGASTRNAGFACFGSMTELLDDLEKQTEDEVFQLVEKRWKGLLRLRERLGDQVLDYEELGAYELFRNEEEYDFEKCLDQLPAFNRILKEITGVSRVFEPQDNKISLFGFSAIKHLIHNRAEGQLNPGKMMQGLWQMARTMGIAIYSGIEVRQLENHEQGMAIHCQQLPKLFARKVLLATNGFTRRILPDLEVLPARNQVLITKPIPGLPFKGCFHYDKGYYYFRNVGQRILFGGGRNLAKEAEQTDEFGHTAIIQNKLQQLLNEMILPGVSYEIEQWWSGILGVGSQKAPICQQLSPHLFTAVRLGGMGVAIGSLVGEEAAELMVTQ